MDWLYRSQLTELQPFLDATDRLIVLMEQLKEDGIELHHLDLGGGLGVPYHGEQPPSYRICEGVVGKLRAYPNLEIILEPGRAISANAGILLLQKVEYLKSNEDRNFGDCRYWNERYDSSSLI